MNQAKGIAKFCNSPNRASPSGDSLTGECGKSTVNRIIQRSKESKNAGVPSVPLSQPLECGTMGQDGTADNQPSKTD